MTNPDGIIDQNAVATATADTVAENPRRIINVDRDFAGDLEGAIAAANNGDVVKLNSSRYLTDGIALDKDITIIGQEGSVIDGGGTAANIIGLTPGASGATIQDVEITNGNNAIYGDGALELTLRGLNINNIGISETIRDGQNNSGITLSNADGLLILDSDLNNIGRRGIGVNNTENALISNVSISNINLDAQHAQSYDAGGVKFFNTNDVILRNSSFSNINAFNIWNDTTNSTAMIGNTLNDVGNVFLPPDFNNLVDVSGIYNEKSFNSIVKNNTGTAVEGFRAFNATVFTTESMLYEGNNFSTFELNTEDFWANAELEKLVAITEDPQEANFDLFSTEFFAGANIG